MKLSEARKRYIGKQFRIKHAERGSLRMPYVIENEIGVCTNIDAYWYEDDGVKKYWFSYRIDCPGLHDKWFSAREIELVS